MADLEAVLADVSYLMAMEKSKLTPAARASKKIVLPDPRFVRIFHNIFRSFSVRLKKFTFVYKIEYNFKCKQNHHVFPLF